MSEKTLFAALAKAQGEMEALVAGDTAKVGQYSYNYADLATVQRVLRKPLASNGLGVYQYPEVTYDSGVHVHVSTVLFHADGEKIEFPALSLYCGQTATPQQIGGSITYARRYALLSIFGLAPEDDDAAGASQNAATQPRKANTQVTQPVAHRAPPAQPQRTQTQAPIPVPEDMQFYEEESLIIQAGEVMEELRLTSAPAVRVWAVQEGYRTSDISAGVEWKKIVDTKFGGMFRGKDAPLKIKEACKLFIAQCLAEGKKEKVAA